MKKNIYEDFVYDCKYIIYIFIYYLSIFKGPYNFSLNIH